MPSKPTSSKTSKSQVPGKNALDAINSYLSQKPDLDELIKEAKANPRRSFPGKRQTEYDRKVKESVREVLYERRQQAEERRETIEMPSHPKDGSASGELAGKESKSSNVKATIQDHKATPGPVITTENPGEPASKEELRKRAEELNKK